MIGVTVGIPYIPVTVGGVSDSASHLLTEGGDILLTESSDHLITE